MNKAKKRSKRRMSKFEKMLYSLAVFFIVLGPVAVIVSQSTLSGLNYDVEGLKNKITVQKRTNESIQMMINELANLERIEEVAKASGLNLNNDNIFSINK